MKFICQMNHITSSHIGHQNPVSSISLLFILTPPPIQVKNEHFLVCPFTYLLIHMDVVVVAVLFLRSHHLFFLIVYNFRQAWECCAHPLHVFNSCFLQSVMLSFKLRDNEVVYFLCYTCYNALLTSVTTCVLD